MKQVFNTFDKWEDYKNGMFSLSAQKNKLNVVCACVNLLSNASIFSECIEQVFTNWPVSTSENMTNRAQNRRAWLGAACCSFKYGAYESTTRLAWSLLEPLQQEQANKIADAYIKKYERENSGIRIKMGEPMLF